MPENEPAEIDRALRQPLQVNASLDVAARQGFWNFQPDRDLTDRQDFDPYNVWYYQNGGTVGRSVGSVYALQTDGTQADSRARLETADIGVYKPGVAAHVSGGVWLDVPPEGDAYYTIGYGEQNDPEALHYLVDSSQELKFEWDSARYVNGPLTITPDEMMAGEKTIVEDDGSPVAEVYGIAKQDGLGPDPRRDFEVGRGYVFGITLGWYGPTSIMPWIGTVSDHNGRFVQRAWPLALVRPVRGPAVEKPNRPFQVTAYNGTSGQDLQARVGGRQFATSGEVSINPSPTFDFASEQSIPSSGTGEGDWSVVAVMKRKAGFTGTELGVSRLDVVPQSVDIAALTRVVDPQYLSGVEYDEPVDVPAAQTALELDLATDTPDRVTIDTASIDGTQKVQGVGWSGGLVQSTNSSTGDTQLGAGFDFPIVRNYPTVVLAATRTANKATVTTALEILEAG